jgi:hypothetical protein
MDYCDEIDVALIAFSTARGGAREVGTSVNEGHDGNWGTQEINNWYPIAGILPVEMIPVGRRDFVHKSAATSGTTTGSIDMQCANVYNRIMAWRTGPVWARWDCQYFVDEAGWGGGDSGAAVFARQIAGGPYYALGINNGGDGPHVNQVCTSIDCRFYFTAWAAIEAAYTAHAGITSLNPSTVIP